MSEHTKCVLATSYNRRESHCQLLPPCAGQHGNPLRLAPLPCAAWPIRGAAAASEFWRWRPPKWPICRSDMHPPAWRSADRRASISRRSDRAWSCDGARPASPQSRHFWRLSRERATNSEHDQDGHDPCDALYERYTGCFQRIAIPEREKGSGSQWFHRSVSL